MLPETILFIGGGLGIFFVILLLAIGAWSSFGDKKATLEKPLTDYDEAQKYLEKKPTLGPIQKAALEFENIKKAEEAFDPCNHPDGHAYDYYSDSELFEMFSDHKYGKIITKDITWIELELARRLVYGEIKKTTKEEKALSRKIASHFRTND